MKNLTKIFLLFFVFISVLAYVNAANLDITSVEINNHYILEANGHTNNYKYQLGEKLNIDVCVQALTDVANAQVEAQIYGYQYANRDTTPVDDSTDTFDLSENDSQCHTLNLQVPERVDKDYYKLRIIAADRDGILIEKDFELHLTGVSASNAVIIKDYTLDPQEIIAGRAFTAQVRVKNIGNKDLTDSKVTISIPDLNVETSQYMDTLNADESKTFEELLLRIPECTKAGKYDVDIKVEFDEYEEATTTGQITVKASDTCNSDSGIPNPAPQQPDKSVISVPNSQELSQGSSIVYPIMIGNSGATSKTYTLSIAGASSWATARLDPSSVVVVPAGQSKTVYLSVIANDNADLGDKIITLTVDTGTESKQIPLTAKITKNVSTSSADWSGFKNWLEIGLVVLVIVLLIIGLIIGFNKMKDNKEESEPYY